MISDQIFKESEKNYEEVYWEGKRRRVYRTLCRWCNYQAPYARKDEVDKHGFNCTFLPHFALGTENPCPSGYSDFEKTGIYT